MRSIHLLLACRALKFVSRACSPLVYGRLTTPCSCTTLSPGRRSSFRRMDCFSSCQFSTSCSPRPGLPAAQRCSARGCVCALCCRSSRLGSVSRSLLLSSSFRAKCALQVFVIIRKYCIHSGCLVRAGRRDCYCRLLVCYRLALYGESSSTRSGCFRMQLLHHAMSATRTCFRTCVVC